jgi:competence protein ComEA
MLKTLAGVLVGLLAWVSLAFAAIDINSASEAELDKIKGVGPAKAKAIADERKKNGPFKSLEDVANRVKGIGDKTVADWKKSGEVTVGGAKPASKKDEPAKAVPHKGDDKKSDRGMEKSKSDDKPAPKKGDDKKKDDKKDDKKKDDDKKK